MYTLQKQSRKLYHQRSIRTRLYFGMSFRYCKVVCSTTRHPVPACAQIHAEGSPSDLLLIRRRARPLVSANGGKELTRIVREHWRDIFLASQKLAFSYQDLAVVKIVV